MENQKTAKAVVMENYFKNKLDDRVSKTAKKIKITNRK